MHVAQAVVLLQIVRAQGASSAFQIGGCCAKYTVVARQLLHHQIVQVVLSFVDIEIESAGNQVVVVISQPDVELDRRVVGEKRRN